ncbi:MAG: octanoyltransferase, partial [Burkholderiales bacterium]
TYHGVALNVAMDLTPFQDINPCGYAGLVTTDMASCGIDLSLTQAANALVRHLEAQLLS